MKLAQYLIDNGLTQAAFAAQIGVTQSNVARYVTGVRRPRHETILAIQRVTKDAVRPDDFYGQSASAAE